MVVIKLRIWIRATSGDDLGIKPNLLLLRKVIIQCIKVVIRLWIWISATSLDDLGINPNR